MFAQHADLLQHESSSPWRVQRKLPPLRKPSSLSSLAVCQLLSHFCSAPAMESSLSVSLSGSYTTTPLPFICPLFLSVWWRKQRMLN